MAFEDLAAKVRDQAMVAQLVIDLYPRNWLDLLPDEPGFVATPGPRPMVTPLVRAQIAAGDHVTDLRHRSVTITDPFTKQGADPDNADEVLLWTACERAD
jgi:hypothetical protein